MWDSTEDVLPVSTEQVQLPKEDVGSAQQFRSFTDLASSRASFLSSRHFHSICLKTTRHWGSLLFPHEL